jgi:hypothetical protein
VSAPPVIPTPTALRHSAWFPVAVVLPGATRQRNNVKVFATDTGLYVYDIVPADPRQDPPTPLFHSPIVWERTERPYSGVRAGAGTHIVTEAGTVAITPLGGCACNHRALRDWFPPWATIHQQWDPANP